MNNWSTLKLINPTLVIFNTQKLVSSNKWNLLYEKPPKNKTAHLMKHHEGLLSVWFAAFCLFHRPFPSSHDLATAWLRRPFLIACATYQTGTHMHADTHTQTLHRPLLLLCKLPTIGPFSGETVCKQVLKVMQKPNTKEAETKDSKPNWNQSAYSHVWSCVHTHTHTDRHTQLHHVLHFTGLNAQLFPPQPTCELACADFDPLFQSSRKEIRKGQSMKKCCRVVCTTEHTYC